MAQSALLRLIPGASSALRDLLDVSHGTLEPPIRSELFGAQRFAQHGRSLGETHRAARETAAAATFFPRLQSNISTLRHAHRYIGIQAATGYDVSPAAEWLLDNFHLIEAQLKQIHEGMPRRYYRDLPVLLDPPLAGLPRVYGVAWAFVAHTDSAFDEELLMQFLVAYQQTRELSLGELWALPTTLRVVLIENLRRLAERIAANKAAREVADLCSERLERYTIEDLDSLLALLNERGVGHVYLAQMARRSQRRDTTAGRPATTAQDEWLDRALPGAARVQTQQDAEQAADNLSVSNAVTSLRAINDADWSDLIAHSSALMQLMLSAPVFEAEHSTTRSQTLQGIEVLARRNGCSERKVAQALLALMRGAPDADSLSATASHWLFGGGRPALVRAINPGARAPIAWRALIDRLALPVYLSTLLLATLGLVAWVVLKHRAGLPGASPSPWLVYVTAMLMAFPASEMVVAVINRLISESTHPRNLPRLALAGGMAADQRTMVVVPAMLVDAASTRAMAHRLLLHYLANPEGYTQFALLTDWADGDAERAATDADLLSDAVQQIDALNRRYPFDPHRPEGAPRFLVLHRARTFSESEQRWIGWERKRGKLETLVAALAQGTSAGFIDLGRASCIAADTRYIVTLDSDTQLPPGRLRELVGIAAHPYNQPQLDAAGRRVVRGYGILQPRVVTPLPALKEVTRFHWLFAGQCGIDPYSAASSEVYQDLFGEGTFTGKGLLNVRAMHAVLSHRLPEGQVLSHDLLEGSLARCAAVTDITLIEDAPFHADVAASRVHRWTRGDWQLLPIVLHPMRFALRGINRWKMFDNLRRSLVAPMSLALLIVTLAGAFVSPWMALALVFAAFSAGPLMGAVAGLWPTRDDVAKRHFYRQCAIDLARALLIGVWHLAQLLQHALAALDAIALALYRTVISRRHLLQWTTAAAAQAAARTSLRAAWRLHWTETAAALLVLGALWVAHTPMPALALVLCLIWSASPVWTWWVSRPRPPDQGAALAPEERIHLERIARDTWRLFARWVGAVDHHLPPDNLQTSPQVMVAHRTSPTNIGLYLLSVACARRFGWIGTQELLTRMEATLAVLLTLPRHRGHFFNWYDTRSCAPLLPMYVSTVDSGNFSAHLLAVAQSCLELARMPHERAAEQRALQASHARIAGLHSRWPGLLGNGALARLLALSDPIAVCDRDVVLFGHLVHAADDEMNVLLPVEAPGQTQAETQPQPADRAELLWCLADHLATLRSIWLDAQPHAGSSAAMAEQVKTRLQALAQGFEQLGWQADFGFLYHRKRHLFHIGYRVAEQQLDAGYYDLLASESRLTSLLAIAKGEVPVAHWYALDRPFYAVGVEVGLRSWSGSMFEYLMPTLVLDEPDGSVTHDACHAALREQITFAERQGVPWGISESAYAERDHTLAYQYAPHGVPRLALRRSSPDELVIAPYATALAAQIAPHRAAANFVALEALDVRTRYGFIEALDFSPSRRTDQTPFAPVGAYMSHHQGMSIVALANVLLDGIAQRWGMANAHIEAVASLLHERVPREVSTLHALPPGPPPLQRSAPGLFREVVPGMSAIEPTHLLSNGRYQVALRANGAGWSRWSSADISRWRDDALRDAYGSFYYVRWDQQPRAVSITQHPAPDPSAHYKSTYHADRVCFDAAWVQLQVHSTAWVSPEDDIEFRQIELRNLSDRTLDIELMSAFEVSLIDARADEAHPAFTNLFVHAQWRAQGQALVFERTPRLPTEQRLQVAHFLAESDAQVVAVRIQTDRARWLGRNHGVHQPRAEFDDLPSAGPDAEDTHELVTGLDPVCALSVRLRIAPNAKAQLTFATAASDNGGVLSAVIDKYRQHSHVQRASLMSATLTAIRLRALGIGRENFAAIQTLTSALVLSLSRPQARTVWPGQPDPPGCDRRLLWRFGISGDRPLILVSAGLMQGLGFLRSLAQAMHVWSWGGIACDLVVVNSEPASYQMELQREISALRARHRTDRGDDTDQTSTGFHVLRADDLTEEDQHTLQMLARVRLDADGRSLLHHLQEWQDLHEQDYEERHATSTTAVATMPGSPAEVPAPHGEFVDGSGEFVFDVAADLRPARPWINVLANAEFGAQLSETGAGYTWAVNSRLNQLTAWSNDAVADPPAEWWLLQDLKTQRIWSVAPSAWGDDSANYRVTHTQGCSTISHRRGDADVTAVWCVDAHTSVKQIRLRIVNRGQRPLQLRVIGIAEWMMGANRADRSTVHTSAYRQRLPAMEASEAGADATRARKLTALMSTQLDRAAGFGGGTAFLALAGATDEPDDWTCDRRECFDARGRLVVPDHLGQSAGSGIDPCAALSARVDLAGGEAKEWVFLIGYAPTLGAARQLAASAANASAADRLHRARASWDALLGAATVKTPDRLFDALVNHWLLYQTISCRLWAKSGFYQAGGATGFRDQLQDTMALAWAAPELLRAQIVRCASRQFAAGDVQHWWHAPTGAGVRTHFSDDLLWLAHACVHYLRATGDTRLLDERVPFIEGAEIPPGADDAYYVPTISSEDATVFEHAARAIDRSLAVGVHGLPLMGGGDWNDGMNRVGHGGAGESVWLGWFLSQLVADFAPLARARGEGDRALRWENAALGWKRALLGPAWDGQWFRRAFFDDGQPLGSASNAEGQIDLIAQAWSVFADLAPEAMQAQALASVEAHLVDHQVGLIRLLAPPFVQAMPSPGYLQGYPPGVRENGAQYAHAGVWALMALARRADHVPGARHAGDAVYRYFTYLSPAHRASHARLGAAYGVEPYVMAADVYAQPPYVGRGGWTWYTGAAAWMHRAVIESIFGLQQDAHGLRLQPCLPSHWDHAELTLKRGGRSVRFVLVRATADGALAAAAPWSGSAARLLRPRAYLPWPGTAPDGCFVVPVLDAGPDDPATPAVPVAR